MKASIKRGFFINEIIVYYYLLTFNYNFKKIIQKISAYYSNYKHKKVQIFYIHEDIIKNNKINYEHFKRINQKICY